MSMSMATIPDALMNILDSGLGVAIIYTIRSSTRYKLWEILRLLNTMLNHEKESVRNDGAEVLSSFLQIHQSNQPGEIEVDWKLVIPELLFQPTLSEKPKEENSQAQESLIKADRLSPLSRQDLKDHWDDLVVLYLNSARMFKLPKCEGMSMTKNLVSTFISI